MKLTVLLLSLGGFLLSMGSGSDLPAPFTEHCIVGEKNLYPPTGAAADVPWYVIDLDSPARDHWKVVADAKKVEIRELLDVIKNLTYPLFGSKLIDWVDSHMDSWNERLPQPYQDELAGIAEVTGMPLGEIVLYNIFYEVFTVCTSIIAEDNNGKIFHARNLDFGLFMGWDPVAHDWMTTRQLRKLIVNVEFRRGGKTLYKSVNFAGFVGMYNGVVPGKFSITANERFDLKDGGYVGILQWLAGKSTDRWMTFNVRDVLESAQSYEEAAVLLKTTPLMSPVYYILGGVKSGEGQIIYRTRAGEYNNATTLDLSQPDGWYVLQTNYDTPYVPPLFIDDRDTPGRRCMNKLGRDNVGFAGIFNVLSSTSNLNKLTAYTVLMQAESGALETYLQECPQPCWAF